MTKLTYWIWAGLIPLICVILDQASKIWAVSFFAARYPDIPADICRVNNEVRILHEVSKPFDLKLACNTGVSFSMFSGGGDTMRWALVVFAVIVTSLMLWILRSVKDRFTALALALIIGGSIGNIIDRVRYGAVVDFLDFSGIGFNAVFNIADSFITAGVIGMLYAAFFIKEPDAAPKAKP